MTESKAIELLKALLLREVDLFCRSNQASWKLPVSQMLEEIKRSNWRAVFFGGTLRSLLLSRLVEQKPGRPRDVDLVIQGPPLQILRKMFEHFIARETRFGGLQLKRSNWVFDVWPLDCTWALVEEKVENPDFADLPRTTFLNLEAVAVEVWPESGHYRKIFSGDDQFFRAILRREIEINREENPYPELCVVRSLIMANETGFALGSRLIKYIAHHGADLTLAQLEDIQEKHYGFIKIQPETLLGWIHSVSQSLDAQENQKIRLTIGESQSILSEHDVYPYPFLRTVERWLYQRTRHERDDSSHYPVLHGVR